MHVPPSLISIALAVAAGSLGGIALFAWRAKVQEQKRKRIPKRWPLHSRAVANTEECRVWGWLGRVFYDHHIMVKIPVTRFTVPHSREQGTHWHRLLNGVYCTFSVCAADGRVVGCVDVPRKNGISRSNRQLKATLLSQCGIAYCVVSSHDLPSMEEIRGEFLGEAPVPAAGTVSQDSLAAARDKLRVAIDRQRHNRPGAHGDYPESEFGVGTWQQNNSFIAPLDSRKADLR